MANSGRPLRVRRVIPMSNSTGMTAGASTLAAHSNSRVAGSNASKLRNKVFANGCAQLGGNSSRSSEAADSSWSGSTSVNSTSRAG